MGHHWSISWQVAVRVDEPAFVIDHKVIPQPVLRLVWDRVQSGVTITSKLFRAEIQNLTSCKLFSWIHSGVSIGPTQKIYPPSSCIAEEFLKILLAEDSEANLEQSWAQSYLQPDQLVEVCVLGDLICKHLKMLLLW